MACPVDPALPGVEIVNLPSESDDEVTKLITQLGLDTKIDEDPHNSDYKKFQTTEQRLQKLESRVQALERKLTRKGKRSVKGEPSNSGRVWSTPEPDPVAKDSDDESEESEDEKPMRKTSSSTKRKSSSSSAQRKSSSISQCIDDDESEEDVQPDNCLSKKHSINFDGLHKKSYDEAFEEVGGSQVVDIHKELSAWARAQTVDPALEELVQDLLPRDPRLRKGYSVGPVFQKYSPNFRALYQRARGVLRAFQENILGVAEATSGKAILAPLKGKKRSKMKALFKYRNRKGDNVAWYRLTDLNRATLAYNDIDGMYKGLAYFVERHQGIIKEINDRYIKPMPGGYRDIQIVYEHDGVMCELQFNTFAMLQAKETSGHRSYDVRRELEAAVQEGDLELTTETLQWGLEHLGGNNLELTTVLNAVGKGGARLLHEAARSGHAGITYNLLQNSADPDVIDEQGNTPLHFAAREGNDQCVWALLDGGANWEIENRENETPLLLGYLTLRQRSSDHDCARLIAMLAYQSGPAHVSATLKKVDGAVRKRYFQSSDVVDFAADGRNDKLWQELQEFADPDSRDREGRTALVAAAGAGKKESVLLLLNSGASLEMQSEVCGHTPLKAAVMGKHHDVVKLLLKAGAQMFPMKELLVSFTPLPVDFFPGAANLFGGICSGQDGKLYCPPLDADAVLVFDPITKLFKLLKHPELRPGVGLYVGICCAGDGKSMYCAPRNAKRVLKINAFPVWGETPLTFIDGDVEDVYFSIGLGSNGNLYCPPGTSSKMLVIEPEAEKISFVPIEVPVAPEVRRRKQEHKLGLQYYKGICDGMDGHMYCAPHDASSVLVFDPHSYRYFCIDGAGSEEAKFHGICFGPDSKLYCGPSCSNSVLIIDPASKALAFLEGAQKHCHGEAVLQKVGFGGICRGPSGHLFCCPAKSTAVLKINPMSQSLSFIKGVGSDLEFKNNGICFGPDEKLYCAPDCEQYLLCVDPRCEEEVAADVGGEAFLSALASVKE